LQVSEIHNYLKTATSLQHTVKKDLTKLHSVVCWR